MESIIKIELDKTHYSKYINKILKKDYILENNETENFYIITIEKENSKLLEFAKLLIHLNEYIEANVILKYLIELNYYPAYYYSAYCYKNLGFYKEAANCLKIAHKNKDSNYIYGIFLLFLIHTQNNQEKYALQCLKKLKEDKIFMEKYNKFFKSTDSKYFKTLYNSEILLKECIDEGYLDSSLKII